MPGSEQVGYARPGSPGACRYWLTAQTVRLCRGQGQRSAIDRLQRTEWRLSCLRGSRVIAVDGM